MLVPLLTAALALTITTDDAGSLLARSIALSETSPSEICQERPEVRRCWGGCGRNLWACVSSQPGGLCGACSGRPWTGHPRCESTCQVRVLSP